MISYDEIYAYMMWVHEKHENKTLIRMDNLCIIA